MNITSTKGQLEEFLQGCVWRDMKNELSSWKSSFISEYDSVIDEEKNLSTASVLTHLGDIHGRIRAVDYILALPEQILNILEDSSNAKHK